MVLWIRRSLLVTLACLLASWGNAADFTEPTPESKGLTAYLRDNTVHIRYENQPLLAYRAQQDLKYPYFGPLAGPASGLSLTTETCEPYPHHRGLWFGCDPLNGGNYWADNGLESGQIRSTKLWLDETASTDKSVVFYNECNWQRGKSNPFRDTRRFAITRVNNRLTILDCAITLTAQENLRLFKAKHSFFAVRAAADISPAYGGTLVNSEGQTGGKATHGQKARWCAYYGKRRNNPNVVEGIALMTHPDNFEGDNRWFTRDYGHLSASPIGFLKRPIKMKSKDQLSLKYRVALFAGTPEKAGIESLYDEWVQK